MVIPHRPACRTSPATAGGSIPRFSSRLLWWPLAVLLAGCATQRPPVDALLAGNVEVSVESAAVADRLKPDQVLNFERPAGRRVPADGTVELMSAPDMSIQGAVRREGASSGSQRLSLDCGRPGWVEVVPCGVIQGVMMATLPFWIVPALIVQYDRRNPTPEQIEAEAAATEAELQREAAIVRARENITAAALPEKLDETYAAALRKALERTAPAGGEVAIPAQPATSGPGRGRARVIAALSRISLVRTPQGMESLTVCARAMVETVEFPLRYFETCSSEPVTPAQLGSIEGIYAELLSRTQKLAVSMAGALRRRTIQAGLSGIGSGNARSPSPEIGLCPE